jgi:hypothetical protein
VTEEVEDRDHAGRPRLLHPEVAGSWSTPGAYAWLATLLSDAIRGKQDPRQVGRQNGHRRAAEIAGTRDRVDLLEAEMTVAAFVRPGYNVVVGSTSCSAAVRSPRSRPPILAPSANCTSVWPKG